MANLEKQGLWVTGVIEKKYISAKVFDQPSKFGINNSRVSKLKISQDAKGSSKQTVYSYDRGLNFSNIPESILNQILLVLQELPKTVNH